jgi:hypothetical protein
VEQQLHLLAATPGMLTEGAMPEYLFRRTNGIVGLLERLIEDACTRAIDTGIETITSSLLEDTDIHVDTGTAVGAEIPDVPKKPPRPAPSNGRGQRRPRNTTFDDRGTTACAVPKFVAWPVSWRFVDADAQPPRQIKCSS